MSRRVSIALATSTLLAACVVGPKYTPDVVITPSERIGVSRTSDSARVFFDSLAVARRRDEDFAVPRPVTYRVASRDSLESIAWLEIIRDSTLVQLVDVALRQNKSLLLAEARIREFRAAVGVARAPLAPSLNCAIVD